MNAHAAPPVERDAAMGEAALASTAQPTAGRNLRPLILLVTLSLISFWVSAASFTTLGVLAPRMVKELHWSWTTAGIGFTVLGASTGLSSYFPRYLIRRFGVRAALLAGAVIMAAGLTSLGETRGAALFFLGTALCGAGYQTMAIIPATYVIGQVFPRPSLPLGIYFTCFALGSVAGPFIALGVLDVTGGNWRQVWQLHAADMLAWGAIGALMIGSSRRLARDAELLDRGPADPEQRALNTAIWRTPVDWTFEQAARTPQFWLIASAYMSHMLVAISVSSLSIPHLAQRGVPTATAAAMLSLEQLTQTAARGLGGILGDRVEPRLILVVGLMFLVVGPVTLTFADGMASMLLYAVATGLGYGLTVFSAVVLLLNYFGRSNNLEVFTAVSFSGAIAALGPAIGGHLRDVTGNFQAGFCLFAGVNLAIFVGAVLMRPPRHPGLA